MDIPALFLALKADDTPMLAKIFARITVAYTLSPIDLVPDFIPVLGYLDDVILLPMLVALTINFVCMVCEIRWKNSFWEKLYMLVFFEGIVMCFILVMYCVVGIKNGLWDYLTDSL